MPRLATSIVTASGSSPTRACLFLHGILGTRSNWRGLARRIVAERPDWAAVLVDLREHGDSRGFSPPHTVDAAARDLLDLALDLPVEGVLGHSFGGKVALAYTGLAETVTHLVSVESTPSAREDVRAEGSIQRVIEVLSRAPQRYETRDAFIAVLEGEGLSTPIAQWLAMNLERDGEAQVFPVDLSAIRALIGDYFTTDYWSVIDPPREGRFVTLVVGGRSNALDASDVRRAEGIASRTGRLEVHRIEDAGHWVHVDAPDDVVRLAVNALGR